MTKNRQRHVSKYLPRPGVYEVQSIEHQNENRRALCGAPYPGDFYNYKKVSWMDIYRKLYYFMDGEIEVCVECGKVVMNMSTEQLVKSDELVESC